MKKFQLYKLPDTVKRVKTINLLRVEHSVLSGNRSIFVNKAKVTMYLLILDKIGNSHLVYLCNHKYGVGNFHIVNTIQLQVWDKEFIETIKDYGNWRWNDMPFKIIEKIKTSKVQIEKYERVISDLQYDIETNKRAIEYLKNYSFLI